jgi:nicotinic acid mononucleotide adenylyltransferase
MPIDAAPSGDALPRLLRERGWRPAHLKGWEERFSPSRLDTALRLALDICGHRPDEERLAGWRKALYPEVCRRLFPQSFPTPSDEVCKVADHFIPLANAVVEEQAARGGPNIAGRMPFRPLRDEEIDCWPSGEEYRRMLGHMQREGVLPILTMAQEWLGLSILDHVLGVTGLSLWIGRQLVGKIPVDLPLLHGGAIGHDLGKFGCVGDEVRRIPRLHYYYTHIWYQDRGLGSLGHIATNHSCWDLELVRLPIETLLLIYGDFRVKDWPGPDGKPVMQVISLADSFEAIAGKLENLDKEKIKRYRGVYRKLRDLEEYLQYLGVNLNAPDFPNRVPPRPVLPDGLDVLGVLSGAKRPHAVALATGRGVPTLRRVLVTAHNLGVMERLRDLPALRALIEEARSFERWRDIRTYLAIIGEYSPAFSTEQKGLALDFFLELLEHRDDDIRYQAAARIGELLASKEDFWRKDLPAGVVLRQERTVLDELERVLALLDRAPRQAEEDMAPVERVLYAIPIIVRRLLTKADEGLRQQAWQLIKKDFENRRRDRRPLVGLYVCEALEIATPLLPPEERRELIWFVRAFMTHDITNTRLMAWRLLLALAREAGSDPELLALVKECVDLLASRVSGRSLPAELYLVEELAWICDLVGVAQRCKELRKTERDPVREVFLRNLKSHIGWVEKKVNCDYLTTVVRRRLQENRDPGAYFAHEVASHFGNMLKVSRVEGTRFHAGRCLLELLPVLHVTQRNEVTIELLRSLELDAEAITRYIPRFLGSVLASLPDQEFTEVLDDIETSLQRGTEGLQRLLLQTVCWVLLSIEVGRLEGKLLRRLVGMLLGALAESRIATANEAYAQVAMVLERLSRQKDDGRLQRFRHLASKKLFSLITHRPGDRVRFFLAASALNHLQRAVERSRRGVRFAEHPSVALIPGTYDPFTRAHETIVGKALEYADEALVQMDDYSWRKHALPRNLREELAWMALAATPEAYLAPFSPPVNLANPEGLKELQRRVGNRRLLLVVGSDVLARASAYSSPESPIWDLPHIIVVREGATPPGWELRIGWFRRGVSVVLAPATVTAVSSTSLRAALDRHAELEPLCHPLVARTLTERRLYVNYPANKEPVPPPAERNQVRSGNAKLPGELTPLVHRRYHEADGGARVRKTCLLSANNPPEPLAGLAWREVPAAVLPVVAGDGRLARAHSGGLVGMGALVETIAAGEMGPDSGVIQRLLSEVMQRWLHSGLLFALAPTLASTPAALRDELGLLGASWLRGEREDEVDWALLRLTDPLVLLWDLEGLIHPSYVASARVGDALATSRRALASFFANLRPGMGLLHLHEELLKRQAVAWVLKFLASEPPSRTWVVMGLGRRFSRDIVGNTPTIAIDIERFLTWQGYEGGYQARFGSPPLQEQLAVARELGRHALLLVPVLESVEPVLQVVEAGKAAGLPVREIFIGITDASVRATLELRGIRHHCEVVVPGWQGLLRESAITPYLGGWSILGREPSEHGSLLPSLNDCLPYHHPHHLGLDGEAALDFSRLALERTRELLRALEETFREGEGRLLSVRDLGAVVRSPRCPPLPEGFQPSAERFPSELVAEDLEALARLHPESHAAHRERWRHL